MGDRREEVRGAGVGEEGEGERIYGREGRVGRGMEGGMTKGRYQQGEIE